jgi:pimeloyl-ACP methyl ester carboxylesterase
MNDQRLPWQEFDAGGVTVEYMAHGSGATVLLVHAGVFSDWFRFVGESDALHGFQVVQLRRAGYGQSRPDRLLTLTDHARHAAALARWLCPGEQIHWVGHSSSCQIGLALAIEEPTLVGSLVLLEPAAAGEFQVPASAALGPFFGAAMAAFHKGDIEAAFDSFMRGVCGASYRSIIEARLGAGGVNKAIHESDYFFRDEVNAVREFQFGHEEAARIRQPVLCLEGGLQPAHIKEMSGQISRRTVELLPQTDVVIIPHVNHALPLQDPDAVARAIASFVHGHLSPKQETHRA